MRGCRGERLFFAGVAETAVFADGAVELLDRLPGDVGVGCDHHLSDAVAVVDGEVVFTEVDEDYAYLAAVVGIDSAGGVDDGYAVVEGEAGAGANLAFISLGELHVESGGDEGALEGTQRDGAFGEEGTDVHAGRARRAVGGEGMVALVDYFNLHSFYKKCGYLL